MQSPIDTLSPSSDTISHCMSEVIWLNVKNRFQSVAGLVYHLLLFRLRLKQIPISLVCEMHATDVLCSLLWQRMCINYERRINSWGKPTMTSTHSYRMHRCVVFHKRLHESRKKKVVLLLYWNERNCASDINITAKAVTDNLKCSFNPKVNVLFLLPSVCLDPASGFKGVPRPACTDTGRPQECASCSSGRTAAAQRGFYCNHCTCFKNLTLLVLLNSSKASF